MSAGCEQACGAKATVYAIDRAPGGWGGRYCDSCATALRFVIVDRVRPAGVPGDAVNIVLPHSEVCMHMRVAGTRMWVAPCPPDSDPHGLMAQLYRDDGSKFSIPITRGEAGIRHLTNKEAATDERVHHHLR